MAPAPHRYIRNNQTRRSDRQVFVAQIRVVGHLLRGAVEDHLTHVMLPGLIGGTFWHLRLTLASPRDTLAT